MERQLTAHLGVIRAHAATAVPSLPGRRDALLREFNRVHRARRAPSWPWKLAAAAALVVAILAGRELGLRSRHQAPAPVSEHEFVNGSSDDGVVYEVSADASALSSDDFVAVPWTPPLAPGEMVRMVRAEMYPEALASMGIEVDPALTGNLPVDMVVGEDGLPRAVRIGEGSQTDFVN